MKFRADGGTDISAAVDVSTKMFTTKETERYKLLFSLLVEYEFHNCTSAPSNSLGAPQKVLCSIDPLFSD